MKGSNEKQIGSILLTCMSEEARDLLDKLVEDYEKFHKKDIHDTNGYSALYWACRYSGLIYPANDIIKFKQEYDAIKAKDTSLYGLLELQMNVKN